MYSIDSYSRITQTGHQFSNPSGQSGLKPTEAILTLIPAGWKKTHVFVVHHNGVLVYSTGIDSKDIKDKVAELRAGMDPRKLGGPSETPHFNATIAHKLYQQFFSKAEPALRGVRHLIFVPDGAFQSLPIGVLLTKELKKPSTNYSNFPWLIKKFAISVLPSIASLKALRAVAPKAKAKYSFLGFGDPLLKGHPGGMRGIKLPELYKNKTRSEIWRADTNAVRSLPPLPETANELRKLSTALGGERHCVRTLATLMTGSRRCRRSWPLSFPNTPNWRRPSRFRLMRCNNS